MKHIINPTKKLAQLFIGLVLIAIAACSKEKEHYVRFRNDYFEKITVAKLDEVSYGPIERGVTTGYKYVFPGTFPITIETKSGLKGQGTVNLTGGSPGRNNWLVTINKDGTISGYTE